MNSLPCHELLHLEKLRISGGNLVKGLYRSLSVCNTLLRFSNYLVEGLKLLGVLLSPLGSGLQPLVERLLGSLKFLLGSPKIRNGRLVGIRLVRIGLDKGLHT